MIETKPLFASKTFWFNVLTLVAVMLNRQGEVLDPTMVDTLALALATVGNVILRKITSTKIEGVVS